jgi:hypothetical protein
VTWLNLESEKRLRAVSAHFEFAFLAIGPELMQEVSVCRSKNRFQRFLPKGNASPFDALQINPISVRSIHSFLDFKKQSEIG